LQLLITIVSILKNHFTTGKRIKNAAPFYIYAQSVSS